MWFKPLPRGRWNPKSCILDIAKKMGYNTVFKSVYCIPDTERRINNMGPNVHALNHWHFDIWILDIEMEDRGLFFERPYLNLAWNPIKWAGSKMCPTGIEEYDAKYYICILRGSESRGFAHSLEEVARHPRMLWCNHNFEWCYRFSSLLDCWLQLIWECWTNLLSHCNLFNKRSHA